MSLVEYLGGLVFKLLGMNAERKKEVVGPAKPPQPA